MADGFFVKRNAEIIKPLAIMVLINWVFLKSLVKMLLNPGS